MGIDIRLPGRSLTLWYMSTRSVRPAALERLDRDARQALGSRREQQDGRGVHGGGDLGRRQARDPVDAVVAGKLLCEPGERPGADDLERPLGNAVPGRGERVERLVA